MTERKRKPNDAAPPSQAATSLTLLERLRANEPDAWETMVRLYTPLVYQWCARGGQLCRNQSLAHPVRAGEDERDHPRENDQEGKEHLGEGGDEGCASRGGHRLGRHRPLHDEKVRAPVAKRQHEAESHHEPEPLDANGILRGAPHCPPGVGVGVGGKAARRRDRGELRR